MVCLMHSSLIILPYSTYLGQYGDDWLDEALVPWFSRSLHSRRIGGRHGLVRPSIAVGASLADDAGEGL